MLLCLCAVLTLSLGIVSVTVGVDFPSGQIDFTSQFEGFDFSTLGAGAAVSIALLFLQCICLPLLPTHLSPLWGLCVIASAAAVIAVIQFIVMPFSSPTYTILVINLHVVAIAFLLSRGVLGWLRVRRVNSYLRQYAPPGIVDYYLASPGARVSGESREMTIMFCDIKSFTGISERLDPELLPGWLNRFFDIVCEIVVRHGGTIDKYMGDSVMAFWGAPERSDTHARDALFAAREILPAVQALSEKLVGEGLPSIAVGIGLSTGSAHVGHLGSRERLTYTVVGDAVNTADRLQRCTGAYDLSLIVNDRMTEQVPEFLFRELDIVHVKGRQRFVRIFQPICHEDNAVPNTYRRLQMHRKAMQFYRRGMWADAEKLFKALSSEPAEYAFYRRYVKRLENIRNSDSSADTSFVVDFSQKIG